MYVDLVFELPLDNVFTYTVADELIPNIALYKRVKAPFKNSLKCGIIINIHNNKPDFETKSISEIIDIEPLFDEKFYKLAIWLKEYYVCALGQALFTMLPRQTKEKKDLIPLIEQKKLHTLNEEQKFAVDQITDSIESNKYTPFLLFGITGSGKTEVYRWVADFCRKKNKTTIILVPEISLTPQTVKRFSEIFENRIAVIHSRLNPKEKLYHWKRIQRNEVDIVLGARSAIFAPVNNLGAIIIDEEHESTYKASDTPRYNAKQVAFFIAQRENIPLVLGSATPQIESYYYALNGTLKLLTLKSRFAKEQKTNIEIINTLGLKGTLSPLLIKKIIDRLSLGEQTILFLNRRGFIPYISCSICGESIICPNCSISLTYHKNKNALICHTCNFAQRIPNKCPSCSANELDFVGAGTEKIEELIENTFPMARIKRMDVDTMKGKNSYEKILDCLGKGEIDILIGTQMIAKGLHFPNVTLVGVIDADIALNLPEFRASERIFSLLTQVSGRAGRGDIKGEVVIQTKSPNNYVISLASKVDYEKFYEKEIDIRKLTKFPPFSRILRLILRGKNEKDVESKLRSAVSKIGTIKDVELLGPAECPISKANKYYRQHIILRSNSLNKLTVLGKKYKEYFLKENKVYLEIDTDPFSML